MLYEQTVSKLRQLPEPLLQEVNDFIDFLQTKHGTEQVHQSSDQELAEAGLSDYLSNLEDYEEKLAQGEIHWS